jgi:tetratricopeptide (TPR) repeat protein
MADKKSNIDPSNKSDISADFKRTYLFFYGFVVLGMLIVLFGQWAVHPTAALLWALASLASGGFVGFLFGIPKVAQPDALAAPAAGAAVPAANAAPAAPAAPTGGTSYRLLVNTNLTDISDWLTKIIVGVTLIELQKIPENLNRASLFIADSIGGPEQKSFAGAILVFFSVGGFLGGYLFTRLFLTGAFFRADQPNLTAAGAAALRDAVISQESGSQSISSDAEAAARQILNKRLDELLSLEEIAAWAKAQLIAKNYQAALEGYNKAIALSPTDVKLRVERAVASSGAGLPRDIVKEQLLEAHKWLTPQTDAKIKANLYKELTYAYLYLNPPEGFTGAIQYANEFLDDANNVRIGRVVAKIYTNLACAYGQKYRWHGGDDPVSRNDALNAVKAAVTIDPSVQAQLRMLLDPEFPNKDPKENDLEIFVNDDEFREAVGMPKLQP